ncbi:NADPH-dependent F420 reductase [Lacticaseibacillus daqingensis]|uniref:NADPH-dependent F420 reductase n=1 Tax=Lacticaseibacillus daqingensis TaxID=2486014 RepID=UPI000F78C1D7|nr:NAD(P)-binding domain-containing protein [Lacticaseibacillus daqingensis]
MTEPIIGILGAGKLGTTLARLSVQAGYRTLIANRHAVTELKWVIDTMAPGAVTVSAADLVAQANVIILAIPLSHVAALDAKTFAGKIVLDATNYWKEVDGTVNTISSFTQSSSEVVAAHLSQARVAKAFNHMGYHDLEIEVDRHPEARRAMAFATDDDTIRPTVRTVLTGFGFDPFDLGPLRFGLMLEPGSPLFGEAITTPEFQAKIDTLYDTPFGRKIVAARGERIR